MAIFKIRNGKIYIHGTVNGNFYRKSTNKSDTKINIAWTKRTDPQKYLEELVGKKENEKAYTLSEVGLEAIDIQYKSKDITLKHHKNKLSTFNRNILGYFGNVYLEDIQSKHLVNFINSLKEKNYSNTNIKFIKNLFSSIFKYAQHDLRIINYNPFEATSVKNIDLSWQTETLIYSAEEVNKILNAACGWFKVYLDLSIKYGFRPSELSFVKWEDIDFENGILFLKRAKNIDNEIKEFTKNSKSNKNHFRTIALFDSSLELLNKYYEFTSNKEWIFVNKDNKPFINSQSIIDYHLKPLLKELNIEYKTLYALRRSYASIIKFAGQNIEEIQAVMGHTKGSSVTEKHYISEEVLTIKDRKKQAKETEKLFDIFLDSQN